MSFAHDKRVVVYPAYIDKDKSVAKGRKIPADRAVKNPNAIELYECAKTLQLDVEIENKAYSRDPLFRGRIRVRIFDDAGRPTDPRFPSRRELLLKLAALMDIHPRRVARAKEMAEAAAKLAAKPAAKPATSAPSASGKKGGKKHR